MTALQAVERLARAGADSVFCFVERRAESVLDGVRWQTLTWENAPQSSFGVAMGSGGAPLSLADNARLRGTTRGVTPSATSSAPACRCVATSAEAHRR